jgi:hypothetical protein
MSNSHIHEADEDDGRPAALRDHAQGAARGERCVRVVRGGIHKVREGLHSEEEHDHERSGKSTIAHLAPLLFLMREVAQARVAAEQIGAEEQRRLGRAGGTRGECARER